MTCAVVLDVERSRNIELEFYHVCSATGKMHQLQEHWITNSALIRDNLSWGNWMNFGSENCINNIGSTNSMETTNPYRKQKLFYCWLSFYLVHLAVALNTTELII